MNGWASPPRKKYYLLKFDFQLKFGASAIEPTATPTTDDPTDHEEAKQLESTKYDKSIKSKQYESTEAQRIAHGRYLARNKEQCDRIKGEQHDRIRTE